NPFPKNLGEILKNFDRVLVPEMNLGQLSLLLRGKFLVDAQPVSKVQGKPFKVSEILDAVRPHLSRREVKHAAADRYPPAARPQGFYQRSGCALVPWLRRLRDPRHHAERAAQVSNSAAQLRLYLGDRLLQPLSLLRGELWLPHHPRARAGHRHRA